MTKPKDALGALAIIVRWLPRLTEAEKRWLIARLWGEIEKEKASR